MSAVPHHPGATPLIVACQPWTGEPAGDARNTAPLLALQDDLLGSAVFAAAPLALPGEAPQSFVSTPVLDGHPAWIEAWRGDAPLRAGRAGPLAWRAGPNLLFGAVTLDEADFSPGDGATPLQQAAEAAYRAVFALLAAEGYPYLLRVWNYLDDINGESFGLERYRQFNIGRQDAFLASGRPVVQNVPAACALGTIGGHLVVFFLAGRQAPIPVENPRQTSAYHYPREYGPRSPTFSRAAVVRHGGQDVLFISGTASIVGHRTLHMGDVAAQTRETLANLEAVIAEANRVAPGAGYRLADCLLKIYIRHPADLPAVRAEIGRALPAARAFYLQADVCRADLLVEIEASTGHSLEF
ncbi:chorismate transformation enzyme, FkbO/Hyg5 family [Oryzomicrobium sp.]|uniref:chorismate transformation enzyme, FkbO/Hyg5 family n=1 Tax=Oryzomicrobium sp. TaxID=1911578 RepID=UPI002FE05885